MTKPSRPVALGILTGILQTDDGPTIAIQMVGGTNMMLSPDSALRLMDELCGHLEALGIDPDTYGLEPDDDNKDMVH